jgi:hypothetical protein
MPAILIGSAALTLKGKLAPKTAAPPPIRTARRETEKSLRIMCITPFIFA